MLGQPKRLVSIILSFLSIPVEIPSRDHRKAKSERRAILAHILRNELSCCFAGMVSTFKQYREY